ncbi:hypothetical protein [Massilia sp. BSC265]|uniref:hypothetical protein n=1 Tax=Massilia sp. BSC265 TaxID=1549812 RepID=UPI00126A4793|nr:hypothetical protein [Massilia sp. BSC265]
MHKHLMRSAFVFTVFAAPMAFAQVDHAAATGEYDFKAGSGISLHALSPLQVENLAAAGKVWGSRSITIPR